jgi:hypothetical protein
MFSLSKSCHKSQLSQTFLKTNFYYLICHNCHLSQSYLKNKFLLLVHPAKKTDMHPLVGVASAQATRDSSPIHVLLMTRRMYQLSQLSQSLLEISFRCPNCHNFQLPQTSLRINTNCPNCHKSQLSQNFLETIYHYPNLHVSQLSQNQLIIFFYLSSSTSCKIQYCHKSQLSHSPFPKILFHKSASRSHPPHISHLLYSYQHNHNAHSHTNSENKESYPSRFIIDCRYGPDSSRPSPRCMIILVYGISRHSQCESFRD